MGSKEIAEWGGEGGEGDHLAYNPIGEYYGGRNDKNERHGRGRAEMPNGDLYLGCYFRGKRHGLGVYRYKNGNGARYGGDWNLGIKSGWGTMYFPDASQYTGCWSQGRIHGWGVFVYPNGDEYEGWWYMGQKNGRGIYRTKKTGEKFVGNWVLGLRQGKGMIVRKQHRFIGNWYNDCPRGPGVYIFPDLGMEQHGLYTMFKLLPESIDKYKGQGYQILNIRKDIPPRNPIELENETRQALMDEMTQLMGDQEEGQTQGQSQGQGKKPKVDIMAKTPEQELEEKLGSRMKELIDQELISEASNRMPVSPLWRVVQMTRLITPYLDETVPPPPIPETPMPLCEPEEDLEAEKAQTDDASCKELEMEEEAMALVLAKDHAVGQPYTGSGTCQLNLSNIHWPDDCPPELKCSTMSFSNLDDLKNIVQSVLDKPLEPIDFDKIVAQNLHLFKGQGMNLSDKWKECLEDDSECPTAEMKAEKARRLSNAQEEKPQTASDIEADLTDLDVTDEIPATTEGEEEEEE